MAAARPSRASIAAARSHRRHRWPTEKQRRLCLTRRPRDVRHVRGRPRGTTDRPRPRCRTLPRPMARTTPVVLDHGRLSITVPILSSDRSTGQAVLIALMALAFAAIVLATLTSGSSAAASDGSPFPGVVGGASPARLRRAAATRSPAPRPTRPRSRRHRAARTHPPAPDPSAAPATPQTYKVKSGDTLVGIAAKFGTTPKAITQAERHQRSVQPQDRPGPEDPLT